MDNLPNKPDTAAPRLRRNWFQFRLRTLFVCLTLLCVWLGMQVKWVADRDAAVKWLRGHDGYTSEDPRFGADPNPARAPWQIWLWKARGYRRITIVEGKIPHQELDVVAERFSLLFPEAFVSVDNRTAGVHYHFVKYPR